MIDDCISGGKGCLEKGYLEKWSMTSRNLLPFQAMKSVLNFFQDLHGMLWLIRGSAGREGNGLMQVGHGLMQSCMSLLIPEQWMRFLTMSWHFIMPLWRSSRKDSQGRRDDDSGEVQK